MEAPREDSDAVYVMAVITALENRMHPWHVIFVQQDVRALQDYTRWCESIISGTQEHSNVLLRLIAEHGNDDDPVFYIFIFLATLTCMQARVEKELTQRVDPDTDLPAEINPLGVRTWIDYVVPQVRGLLQGMADPTAPSTFVFVERAKDDETLMLYKSRGELCSEDNDRCVTARRIHSASGLVPVERIADDKYLTLDFFVQEMCHAYVFYVDSYDPDMGPFTLSGVTVTTQVIMDTAAQIYQERKNHTVSNKTVTADDVAVRLLRQHAIWASARLRAGAVERAGLYT